MSGSNECSHARKRLLFAELQDMSKEQILGSLSEFCSSRGHIVDALLTHNQKRRSSERLYNRASFYLVFEAGAGSLFTVCLSAGPLGAHVFAMASARIFRMYRLCTARLEEEWRDLGDHSESQWYEFSSWRPCSCERYYFWHLRQAFDDRRSTRHLLASLATGSDEADSLFDSDYFSCFDIAQKSRAEKEEEKRLRAERLGRLIQRVIAEASADEDLLGEVAVSVRNNAGSSAPGLRALVRAIVDAGTRIPLKYAFRLRGVGRGCDGIYLRGNTIEGIMGKWGATEDDVRTPEDLCRILVRNRNEGTCSIIDCYTGEVFCHWNEIRAHIAHVGAPTLLRDNLDNEEENVEVDSPPSDGN